MRVLREIGEDEMVAAFLRAELASPRFGDHARAALEREGDERRALYGYRGELLSGLPKDIRWYRAVLTSDELRAVRYIDWDYWRDVTNGSRLPTDAQVDLMWYRELARGAADFPELILVGREGGCLVVLEGHVRLTALVIDPPTELEVIVGLSDEIERWPLY